MLNKYFKTKRILVSLVCCASIVSAVNTRDVIDSLESIKGALEQSIQKTDVAISKTDSLSQKEQQRFELLSQRHNADAARRELELQKLEGELSNIERDIKGEIQKQQSLDVRMKNKKSYADFIASKIEELCVKTEKLVALSLPEKKEIRLERIAVLKRDLATQNASPEEGFARLRSILAEEIRFGDEVTITTTSIVRIDGEVLNAKVLRIGNQWMVYVDDDEKHYGVLKRVKKGSSYEFSWKEEVSFQEREMIRNAIDVKMAKKAPSIVNLPLSLSIEKSEVQ